MVQIKLNLAYITAKVMKTFRLNLKSFSCEVNGVLNCLLACYSRLAFARELSIAKSLVPSSYEEHMD